MDFVISNHGSICLLNPRSKAAKNWVAEHLPDDVQYFGYSVAIEPRYVQPILDGIAEDGLEVR